MLPRTAFLLAVGLIACVSATAQAQTSQPVVDSKLDVAAISAPELPDAPGMGQTALPANSSTASPDLTTPPARGQQPKRILGIMPNYRAVSAGAIPPPPAPRQAFKIATQNSFDYSAFVFVGVTSLLAENSNSHPKLGKGVAGYGRYYWRGFLDKTDGNYLVIWALPSVLHEDERYYTKGSGSVLGRAAYSASRILVARNYQGHDTFNGAEIFGRGLAQAVALSYYPSSDRTAGSVAAKYGWALGRDALTNTFREFWPDIAAHLHRRHA